MPTTPAFTHDELLNLSAPLGVRVEQLSDSDRFTYNLIGNCLIRLHVGVHPDCHSALWRKRHTYKYYGKEKFPHPVIQGKVIHPKTQYSTDDIMEAVEAATAKPYTPIVVISPQDRHFVKMQLLSRQMGKCCYCDKKLSPPEATLEHVIPLSRGGADNINNLCVACQPCNAKKANLTLREFYSLT